MSRTLTAEDLLAGAAVHHTVPVPAALLAETGATPGLAGSVVLRPLTVRDIQRVTQAAKDQRVLTSILLVHQALVEPRLTVDQVGSLAAGLVEFLLGRVNAISGLQLDGDDLERAVRAPITRACFVLAREFGWTPAECAELTVGQILVYLEMLARGESPAGATPRDPA
ncbi:MAG: hypothetical protein JNL97_17755 [Verrucomicrobiales bacterium]|nr:hypothetical protein [Verrucomicrobiales bacterium]